MAGGVGDTDEWRERRPGGRSPERERGHAPGHGGCCCHRYAPHSRPLLPAVAATSPRVAFKPGPQKHGNHAWEEKERDVGSTEELVLSGRRTCSRPQIQARPFHIGRRRRGGRRAAGEPAAVASTAHEPRGRCPTTPPTRVTRTWIPVPETRGHGPSWWPQINATWLGGRVQRSCRGGRTTRPRGARRASRPAVRRGRAVSSPQSWLPSGLAGPVAAAAGSTITAHHHPCAATQVEASRRRCRRHGQEGGPGASDLAPFGNGGDPDRFRDH